MNSYALPPIAIHTINTAPTPSAYSSRSSNGEAPDGFARMLDQASAAPPPAEAPRPAGSADNEASTPATRSPAASQPNDGPQADSATSASDGTARKDSPSADSDAGPTRKPQGPVRPGVLPARTALKGGAAPDVSEALNRVDMAAAAGSALEEALAAAAPAADTLASTADLLPDAGNPQPGVLPASTQPGWDAQALLGTWAARPQAGAAADTELRDGHKTEVAGVQSSEAGSAVFGQMARSVDLAGASTAAVVASRAAGTLAATAAAAASTQALPPGDGPVAASTLTRSTADLTLAGAAPDLSALPTGQDAKPGALPLQAARPGSQPGTPQGLLPAAAAPAAQTTAAALTAGAAPLAASSSEGDTRHAAVATAVQAVAGPRRDSLAQASATPGSVATAAAAAQDAGGDRPAVSNSAGAMEMTAATRAPVALEDRAQALRTPIPVDGHAALAAAAGSATQALSRAASENGSENRGELQGLAAASAGSAVAPPAVLAWVAPAAGALAPAAGPVDGRIAASPGTPEFAPQLAAHVTTFVRDGLQHARLELNPAEMGPLTVQIQLDGNAARVHLAAENPQTRQALEQAMPQLAGSLRENGLTLSGGGVFEQPRQPQQQAQQQNGQGKEAREGGNAGNGRDTATSVTASSSGEAPARRRAGVVDLVA